MKKLAKLATISIAAFVLGVLFTYSAPSQAAADFLDCPKNPDGTIDLTNCRPIPELNNEWWKICCDPDPLKLATILDRDFTIITNVTHSNDGVTVSYTIPTAFTESVRSMMSNSSAMIHPEPK